MSNKKDNHLFHQSYTIHILDQFTTFPAQCVYLPYFHTDISLKSKRALKWQQVESKCVDQATYNMYPLGIRSFLLYILVKNTLQPQAKSLFHVTNHSITRKWGRKKVFSKSKTESCQEQFAYFNINLVTVSVRVFLKNFNT